MKEFLKRKNIVISAKRYGIDALGAMAQGLFCSLLIGTILNTLGSQFNIAFLTAQIIEINKVADTSTGVTQYSAEVLLDKAAGMLPGMTADVDIQIEGNENALIIPVDALHQTSTGSFVYTTFDEETQQYGGKVDVVAGMQNDNYAEILSGLQEGDTVYYTEQENIFAYFASMMGGGMPGGPRRGG